MKTVLLVDDEIEFMTVVSDLLSARGFRVETCRNGTDALDRIKARPFDAFVADVVMEGTVGTALLQGIHSSPGCENMPVIFMSGMPERRVRLIIEGNYVFLHKPFSTDALVSAVNGACDHSGDCSQSTLGYPWGAPEDAARVHPRAA